MVSGLHHLAMKCYKSEYNKLIAFYTEVLGLKIKRVWGEGEIPDGVMIDLNNCVLEVFTNKENDLDTGIIRHLALAVDDVDSLVLKIKDAGYDVFVEPKEIVIKSNPALYARIAFCHGPLNEEIELFCEK